MILDIFSRWYAGLPRGLLSEIMALPQVVRVVSALMVAAIKGQDMLER